MILGRTIYSRLLADGVSLAASVALIGTWFGWIRAEMTKLPETAVTGAELAAVLPIEQAIADGYFALIVLVVVIIGLQVRWGCLLGYFCFSFG